MTAGSELHVLEQGCSIPHERIVAGVTVVSHAADAPIVSIHYAARLSNREWQLDARYRRTDNKYALRGVRCSIIKTCGRLLRPRRLRVYHTWSALIESERASCRTRSRCSLDYPVL